MTHPKQIRKEFTNLRNYGCIVMNFNNHKYNNPGIDGHLDWEIYTKKNIIHIEVKIGKDTLRPKQEEVIKRLAHLMGLPKSRIYVTSIKTGTEAKTLADRILGGEL